jgi:antitoxin component YwqK of YwqJK toxin-antitoxin module
LTIFDESGLPIEQSEYKKGQLEGETIVYVDGVIRGKTEYRTGKRHGLATVYNETGQIVQASHLVDGRREGDAIQYYPSDSPSEQAAYRNDRLHGEVVRYYPNGLVREKQNYRDGIPVGDRVDYDHKGRKSTLEDVAQQHTKHARKGLRLAKKLIKLLGKPFGISMK